MKRFWLKVCLHIFRRLDLTIEERNLCTEAILDKLEALPLRDIIKSSEEGVLINGKPADIDTLRALRDSAIAALNNTALNYCGDQVAFLATDRVIRKALTIDEAYFYRAALWFGEQLKVHLQTLSGYGQDSPL